MPSIIPFSLLSTPFFLLPFKNENRTSWVSVSSIQHTKITWCDAHLCSNVLKDHTEADDEFFTMISSIIAFQGIKCCFRPLQLDVKTQHRVEFVCRYLSRASQRNRTGCSALVSTPRQVCQLQILSAAAWYFTSKSIIEWMNNLSPSNSNKQKSAGIPYGDLFLLWSTSKSLNYL